MGIGHNQRSTSIRAVHGARSAVFYTALLSLFSVAVPQNVIAQAVAVPLAIAAKPTEIENVTNLKAQPLALLAKFPNAGPDMARYVAQQVSQQPAIVDALLSVVNDTSPQQASAMGAGMVRAVRVLNAKQPTQSKQITEKVMRSDNKYLTTTFASLGPRFSNSTPFTAPTNLPPRTVVAGDIGFSIGAAWRVGPAENETFTARDGTGNDGGINSKCPQNSDNYLTTRCRGMIVALMTSDAPSNGAVSTSPTI